MERNTPNRQVETSEMEVKRLAKLRVAHRGDMAEVLAILESAGAKVKVGNYYKVDFCGNRSVELMWESLKHLEQVEMDIEDRYLQMWTTDSFVVLRITFLKTAELKTPTVEPIIEKQKLARLLVVPCGEMARIVSVLESDEPIKVENVFRVAFGSNERLEKEWKLLKRHQQVEIEACKIDRGSITTASFTLVKISPPQVASLRVVRRGNGVEIIKLLSLACWSNLQNLPQPEAHFGVRFRRYDDAAIWQSMREGHEAVIEVCEVGRSGTEVYVIVTKLNPDPETHAQGLGYRIAILDIDIQSRTVKVDETTYKFTCPICDLVCTASREDLGYYHINDAHMRSYGRS